jgi:hypothetical protein
MVSPRVRRRTSLKIKVLTVPSRYRGQIRDIYLPRGASGDPIARREKAPPPNVGASGPQRDAEGYPVPQLVGSSHWARSMRIRRDVWVGSAGRPTLPRSGNRGLAVGFPDFAAESSGVEPPGPADQRRGRIGDHHPRFPDFGSKDGRDGSSLRSGAAEVRVGVRTEGTR